MKNVKIKRMILIAMLTAISLVLYILGPKFALPIFPSFLEINFSMLPIFIGLFILGLKDSLLIILLRFLIKLPFSSTASVGEIADLILAIITVVPSHLLMNYVKGRGHSIIQFIGILISWSIAGVISNCFSLPLYMEMYGGKEVIIGAMSMVSNVNASNYFWKYLLICVIPFNLIIASSVLIITFPVHSRLKIVYKNFRLEKTIGEKNEKM